ncbi:hypothetical protein SAMN06265376_102243 [Dokdonia pacifica]|uniref:Uncharacterized protein n=1 Tax=Dokdonia pacifica TaxID=1627892 RepID=A0A238YQH1_9FLAO|nr:hypothetical protein SAMN06265376_102243 [Dokdonia pacifica]
MIKRILNISGVQRLNKSQQKNIIGSIRVNTGDDACGVQSICLDQSEPVWSNNICEDGCRPGVCPSGIILYRSCANTGF